MGAFVYVTVYTCVKVHMHDVYVFLLSSGVVPRKRSTGNFVDFTTA